jgi:hypothetical protein
MGKGQYIWKYKDVNMRILFLANSLMPKDAQRGVRAGLNELRRDSFTKSPQAPFKSGDLRASAKVRKVKIMPKTISGEVVYNIRYAARLHEMEKYEKPTIKAGVMNPGPKFLETKVVQFKQKYFEIIAKSLEKRFKKAGGVA